MKQIFTLVMLVLALADPARAEDVISVARGLALLTKNCSVCHAVGVSGNSTHKDAPPFRVVMKAYAATSLTEALGEGLVTGHPDMPEFVFPPEEVNAIVSYLQTLEKF